MGVNGLARRKEELLNVLIAVEKTINKNPELDRNNIISNISKRAAKQLKHVNRTLKIRKCEELINKVEAKEYITDEAGNRIRLRGDVKDSFINEIIILSQSGKNSYTYYMDEEEDYMDGEAIFLNKDNEIELVHANKIDGVVNYTHYTRLDDMLMQYTKTYTKDAHSYGSCLRKVRK